MDIRKKIDVFWPYLHANPEPAFREIKTSAYVAEVLRKAGYEVQENVGGTTGVVGILDSGRPGPVAAVRSDMDCLLFKQDDGTEKAVHACGHDGHMTTVLAVAEWLGEEGIPCGKVKILFQPAEEIGKGALAMIDSGAVDDVDYLFGLHVMPEDMARTGEIIPQISWTACTLIEAEIRGRAAHGSQPHKGINAIDAGAAVVNAVNALHSNPLLGGNVKTTRFQGGSGSLNAICDKVNLGFDLRSTSNEEMLMLRQKVHDIIVNTASVYGAEADSRIVGTCPAAEADTELLPLVQEAITDVLGQKALLPVKAITVGEDFNFYKQERPRLKTVDMGVGCNLTPCLHDPEMTYDRYALEGAVKVFHELVMRVLTTSVSGRQGK